MQIRCSGLARPMVCAGSLFFTDIPKPEENDAAREGTAAGELLEMQIFLGGRKPENVTATNGVYFDSDMYFYTGPLAKDIVDRAASKVLCEQRIDWQTRSGVWIRGQYDASYIDHSGALCIDDLKYGWGIVDVERNWQLLGYAIGEVIRRQMYFEKIVLRILQPRPHHEDGSIRRWEITYHELLDFKEQIEARMDSIVAGYRDLTTSEKCRYCPAGAFCPALNRAFYHSVDASLSFMQDNISSEELSKQLDEATRAAEVIKTRQESLKALAIHRMGAGQIIPGYVSEASYGDRKWKSGISPDVVEMMTGKKITEQVMLSPSKAEKAGVPKEFVNKLVDRHFLGNKLVKKNGSDIGNAIFGKEKPQ